MAYSKQVVEIEVVVEQCMQFDFFFQAFISMVKVFGVVEQIYYVQYCLMVFDWEGVDWISDVEEICNFYFGDEMLACGMVEEMLLVE